jgi:glycogen synthase
MIAPVSNRPLRRVSDDVSPPLRTVQVGMSWFAERPGGLDRYFCELLRHLPAAGVDAHGLVMGSAQVEKDSGGSVVAVADPARSIIARWRAVHRAVDAELSEESGDMLVSHHALYTLPLLRWLRRVPFVVHFHGPYAAECSTENSRKLANTAKLWMEFGNILHETYGVPQGRIRIIPGGVEMDRFECAETRQKAREKLCWPSDRPIVFCVRRLFRRMGLENLIDAMATIRRDVPDALVMIAGKGWMADELRERIAAAGLADHVKLLGFVPDADLPLAYRAADLTVVPTVALEGFGLTTVESLAAGTPAMVTPVGGSPEVVSGLSSDLIFADVSAAALADGVLAALRGTIALPDYAQCQAYARNHFDWSIVAARVRSVYEEARDAARQELP